MIKRVIFLIGINFVFLTNGVSVLGAQYQYDSLGRVIEVEYDDGTGVRYEYDENGNILCIEPKENTVPESGQGGAGTGNGADNESKNDTSDKNENLGREADRNKSENIAPDTKGIVEGGQSLGNDKNDVPTETEDAADLRQQDAGGARDLEDTVLQKMARIIMAILLALLVGGAFIGKIRNKQK